MYCKRSVVAFVDVRALEIRSVAAVAATKGRRFVDIEATHVTIVHLSRGTDRFLQDVYGRDDPASCDMNCGASPSEIQQAFDAIRSSSIWGDGSARKTIEFGKRRMTLRRGRRAVRDAAERHPASGHRPGRLYGSGPRRRLEMPRGRGVMAPSMNVCECV